MIKSLLFISLAPILIIALYVYIRDRYEKEPLVVLIKALLSGVLIVLPVVLVEGVVASAGPPGKTLGSALYNGFMTAALTEEGFKFAALVLFFWRSRHFNERFDGIVYAVFISLGFAAVENVIYVYRGGYSIGLLRAVTAVPAHAFFGTVMGYHLANAKFYPSRRTFQFILSFFIPFFWHGLYDFLLMGEKEILLVIFIPVLVYFWINGFRKMNELSSASVFRTDLPGKTGRRIGEEKD